MDVRQRRTDSMPTPELTLFLSLPSRETAPGSIEITKKALQGLNVYCEFWGGPVRVFMPPADGPSQNLDNTVIAVEDQPFSIAVRDFSDPEVKAAVARTGIVMGGPDHRLNGMAEYCRQRSVPYVFNCEYTLATRLQVLRSENLGFLRSVRRAMWERSQERANVRSVKLSAGLQCNGTPTYDAYQHIAKNSLLYFDSRVDEAMIPDDATIVSKFTKQDGGAPLRLCFSGRLSPMKGADHLPKVAAELSRRNVHYTMDICGAGPSEPEMRAAVTSAGLGDRVRFKGVLDFETELVPFVRDNVDLFVCCHRQGDPSCTYLETLALGVPIVGYLNEAFGGLLRHVDGGSAVPMDAVDALASAIESAAQPQGRSRLAAQAVAGATFARSHTFRATFRRRMDHLERTVAERARAIA